MSGAAASPCKELPSERFRRHGRQIEAAETRAIRTCGKRQYRADAAGTGPLLPAAPRAAVAEFVATGIFVFAAEGSVYGLWKLYKDTGTPGGLVAVAIAHALALAAAVAVASNASGGHVNPAVTFGVLVGRRISFGRAVVYYWAAKLLGAVAAAFLLMLVSGGTRPVGFGLGQGVHERHALLLEAVMTFGLVYAVYATAVDHRSRVGFVLGANILAGGPFDGAAMNPARAFGPALVGWSWRHHRVYCVGPLIGAGLAGALYEFVMVEQPPSEAPAAAAGPRMLVAAAED
nr:LOW QUALITY PROTEIN: probable aquaporin TIP3-2 [Setaria viridis]